MLHGLAQLRDKKRLLRADMRAKKFEKADEAIAEKLTEVFLKNIILPEKAVVASYAAIRDEIGTESLNAALRARGHAMALPVIVGKGRPLIFRAYEDGDALLANPLGIFEPTSAAKSAEPDVLLIPMLAFDAARNRLGYGGGYYDRTIKALRARKNLFVIGIARADRAIGQVPVGFNDVPMDVIVTEKAVL